LGAAPRRFRTRHLRAAHGARMLAPDMLGYGRSPTPIQHQYQESPAKFFGHTILVTGGSAGIDLKETWT
jgi:hypothetical protein